jgi:hypothetical protein
MKTTLEGSRGHHTAANLESLLGGAGQPHHGAARSAMVAPAYQLPQASSTAS